MKAGTSTHQKVYDLMKYLSETRRGVIGLLTLLWEFTGKYCPRGDIGRVTNEAIARACDWGKKDPDKLVEALVLAGWIDRVESDERIRLYIHDWHEHAESWVRKKLERSGERFANGCLPRGKTREDGGKTREDGGKTREDGGRPRETIVSPPKPLPLPRPIPPIPPEGVVEGWLLELYGELKGTGKMDGLTVEMLALAARGISGDMLARRWREVVMDVQGLAGKACSIMSVLRKSMGRLEMEERRGVGRGAVGQEDVAAPSAVVFRGLAAVE